MLYTPLDQFEVIPIISIFCKYTFFVNDLSISNLIFMLITIFLIILLFCEYLSINFRLKLEPGRYLFIQLIYFVKSLIIENIGLKFIKLLYIIFFLFFFILIANLLGMTPYCFTVTSHIIITLTLSFSFFFAINLIGSLKHGLQIFGLFLPNGAPLIIAPFLIIIEFISYIARVFSLGIRLFANMMAGHTLLTILAGFGWSMLNFGGLFSILFIFPVLIVFAVTGLEISIAFLQAYVFTVLVCIYFNDVIHLH